MFRVNGVNGKRSDNINNNNIRETKVINPLEILINLKIMYLRFCINSEWLQW